MSVKEPLSPFGEPGEMLDELCDDLTTMHMQVKISWHEAQAFPDQADEILDGLIARLKQKGLVASLHLRGAVQRARRKGDAHARAKAAAELRIKTALARTQAEKFDDAFDPWGWFVYILWGDDPDRPVYVGQSGNVLARLGQHLSNSEKRVLVRRISLIRCNGPAEMGRTEMRLISHYRPLLNIVGNTRDDSEIVADQVK